MSKNINNYNYSNTSKMEVRLFKESEDGLSASFSFDPLPRNFATTLGNTFRQVLLSSIPGVKLYAFKIFDHKKNSQALSIVESEYSTVDGILEDLLQIRTNIQEIIFQVDRNFFQKYNLERKFDLELVVNNSKENEEITSSMIKLPLGLKIVNDVYLFTIAKKNLSLTIKFLANIKRGYFDDNDNAKIYSELERGWIFLDTNYSPVINTNYFTEDTKVGQVNVEESLVLEVVTNGVLKPKEVIVLAADFLNNYCFSPIIELDKKLKFKEIVVEKKIVEKEDITKKPLEFLGLIQRSSKYLQRAGIKTIGDLLKKTEAEISKIEHLGSVSTNDIKFCLQKHNLYLKVK